jgi:class 3 adenylate cyclase
MADDPTKPKPKKESHILDAGLGGIKDFAKPITLSGLWEPATFVSGSFLTGGYASTDLEKVQSLEHEIRKLRDDLTKKSSALQKKDTSLEEHKKQVHQLEETLERLQHKQQLAFLLERVAPEATSVLLSSNTLRDKFFSSDACRLFAMSVDIRRSTDLMLKARTPQAFATFITELCRDLMNIVRRHYGVVDKFTGDGILCFFPEFFCGLDAGYYALGAADACHYAFQKHYRAHRSSFNSVLGDIGLGIGIDYGDCHIVQVAGDLTIVGVPVVYACRLGGAPAGKTLLNQPAYETISERHGDSVFLTETAIEIKHEGTLVAYSAQISRTTHQPTPPEWVASTKGTSDGSDTSAPATLAPRK